MRKLTPKAETRRRGGLSVKTVTSNAPVASADGIMPVSHHPEPLLMDTSVKSRWPVYAAVDDNPAI
ncbi:hypothetical protein KCP69_07945 [Salmonella enterica subsp. enterica]|nr:hypothetical protein KCP69_07945 [Salmonella enterica subsp. enterica]